MVMYICCQISLMAAVVDGARISLYHGCGRSGGMEHHSPPPPIPVRLHHAREPRSATALGQGDLDAGNGYLAPVAIRPGPPLPPRQPLRRSVSLTHRAPPEPGTDSAVSGLHDLHQHAVVDTAVPRAHEPTLDEVLSSLRRSRIDSLHPAPLSPALSAPLLGQVSL